VIANVPEAMMPALAARALSVTPLAHGRCTLDLSPAESPEKLIHDLTSQGIQVMSLNPLRTTLEDYFVSTVGAAAPRDTTSLQDPA
jgi:hypothetical protein